MGKRLLLLVTDLLIGGTPSVVRELAIRLTRQGVDVEVACLGGWGPTADQIAAASVKVTALAARGAWDLAAIVRLRRLINTGRFDVVLSLLVHANVAASVALAGRQVVALYQSIQTTQPRPRWHWLAQAAVQHAAQRIIVPSPSVAKAAIERSAVAPERIVVIPNAVDADALGRITPAPAEPGHVRVGFIGRLDPVKRIPDLLQAMRYLPERYRLAIYGAGQEQGRLEREIAQLGLDARVTLRGSVAGPEVALPEIDLLVLPSEAEGFGLVLIEAMAAGVPVIGTDVPGIRDVVEQEQNGLLVAVGDPAALSRAIVRLSDDPALRHRLTSGGRACVRQRYTWEAVLQNYRQTLEI